MTIKEQFKNFLIDNDKDYILMKINDNNIKLFKQTDETTPNIKTIFIENLYKDQIQGSVCFLGTFTNDGKIIKYSKDPIGDYLIDKNNIIDINLLKECIKEKINFYFKNKEEEIIQEKLNENVQGLIDSKDIYFYNLRKYKNKFGKYNLRRYKDKFDKYNLSKQLSIDIEITPQQLDSYIVSPQETIKKLIEYNIPRAKESFEEYFIKEYINSDFCDTPYDHIKANIKEIIDKYPKASNVIYFYIKYPNGDTDCISTSNSIDIQNNILKGKGYADIKMPICAIEKIIYQNKVLYDIDNFPEFEYNENIAELDFLECKNYLHFKPEFYDNFENISKLLKLDAYSLKNVSLGPNILNDTQSLTNLCKIINNDFKCIDCYSFNCWPEKLFTKESINFLIEYAKSIPDCKILHSNYLLDKMDIKDINYKKKKKIKDIKEFDFSELIIKNIDLLNDSRIINYFENHKIPEIDLDCVAEIKKSFNVENMLPQIFNVESIIENIDDLHLIKNKEFIKYLLDKACFEKKECEVYDLAIEYNKDIDITLKLAKISDNHYLNKIMENLQELKINDDIYFDLLSYNINIIEYAPPNISNTYLEAIMQSFDSIEVNSQDIIILKTDYNSIEINNYENNITIIDTFNRMTSLKKEEYEKFINIFINEINERYPGLEIKNISEVINKINMINKIDLEK